MAENGTSYFIAKCDSIASLKKCIATSRWACRDRKSLPQPRDILTQARTNGDRVVLVFSVNNCHGWHGYAEMASDIEICQNTSTNNSIEMSSSINTESGSQQNDWHFFDVKWRRHFLNDFGERCLSSQLTDHDMYTLNDGTPLNKSRNWHEVPCNIGNKVCSLIDSLYEELKTKRQEKLKLAEEHAPIPFFHSADSVELMNENWMKICEKISKELGTIVMACPFGSRRYNLHIPTSDMDMFLVYQARTKHILGFNPPKQTLKSNERECCDFTIHEIFRYGELLLSGDHRCVETLFVSDESMVHTSPSFLQLQQHKHLFINRSCLDKYLRDACGSKGTKQLQRWTDENPTNDTLSHRMCKLAYIIIRLLQNAVDIVGGGPINVYRPEDSAERQTLMRIRHGQLSVAEVWEEINRMLTYIEANKEAVPDHSEEMADLLEDWIIQLRRNDFTK